jgi:hypothetical protein
MLRVIVCLTGNDKINVRLLAVGIMFHVYLTNYTDCEQKCQIVLLVDSIAFHLFLGNLAVVT